MLITGALGDSAQAFIRKEHFDAVSGEILLVLPNDAAFGVFQDQEEVIDFQRMANDPNGQPANELGLEPEFEEVARLGLSQHFFSSVQRTFLGGKTDCGFTQAFLNEFFQSAECAADDEQNVFGVDGSR